jgi:hypothetical protein
VIKALKGGVRGTLEAMERATTRVISGTVHSFERLGEIGMRAGRNAASNLSRLGRAFVRGGRVMFEGLERGFGRGIKSIGEFVEELFERLRFRRFKITRGHGVYILWGYINPWVPLAEIAAEIPRALNLREQALQIEAAMKGQGGPGFARVAAGEGGFAASAIGPGRSTAIEQWAAQRGFRGYIRGDLAEEEVMQAASDLGIPRPLSTGHAEPHLAVSLTGTPIGVSAETCTSCRGFLSDLAHSRGHIVLADPEGLLIFSAGGRGWRRIPNSAFPAIDWRTVTAQQWENLLATYRSAPLQR